jgi:hypothetical protein
MQDIAEGLSFVAQHQCLRPVFITQFIFSAASFMTSRYSCPMRSAISASRPRASALTLAMYGVGMVIGALVATRVMKRLPFGTVIALGPVTGFVASVGDGADDMDPLAGAGRPELLPARRRPDPLGDLDGDAAPVGDAAEPARAGVGHQHPELWRAADRHRDRRR